MTGFMAMDMFSGEESMRVIMGLCLYSVARGSLLDFVDAKTATSSTIYAAAFCISIIDCLSTICLVYALSQNHCFPEMMH